MWLNWKLQFYNLLNSFRAAHTVVIPPAGASASSATSYWAKGTGFGTGSTISSWDIEKAMKEKKKEEEQIVVIFQVCLQLKIKLHDGECISTSLLSIV